MRKTAKIYKYEVCYLVFTAVLFLLFFSLWLVSFCAACLGYDIFNSKLDEIIHSFTWLFFIGLPTMAFIIAMTKRS